MSTNNDNQHNNTGEENTMSTNHEGRPMEFTTNDEGFLVNEFGAITYTGPMFLTSHETDLQQMLIGYLIITRDENRSEEARQRAAGAAEALHYAVKYGTDMPEEDFKAWWARAVQLADFGDKYVSRWSDQILELWNK